MKIEDLIPGVNIEDSTTEFKGLIEEGDNKELNWLKTIVAFANTQGGTLYVGVNDKNHNILALDHQTADKVSLMVHRLIKNRITPQINYQISAIPLKAKDQTRYILAVKVEKSTDIPVSLHQDGLLGIYVRVFGSTVLASAEQIREMVLLSESVPFDQNYSKVLFDKDKFKKLTAYCESKGSKITEKELISIGFMNDAYELSNGALLFADDYNGDKTKVSATLWAGNSKGDNAVAASEVYTGNLIDILQKMKEFIINHSANGFMKTETSRVDYFSYPLRSVTEGISNSIGHRNYFIQGSQIEINIFKDRLEITSPGSLLGVRQLIKEKNLADIIPRRRNEVICNILQMCREMEEKGSGFDKIEEDYSPYSEEYQPFVSSDYDSFTLTLPDLTYTGIIGDVVREDRIYTLVATDGKYDQQILAYCYNKRKTAKEIAELLGVKPSTYFRKETLSKLVEAGLLIESDSGKAKTYRTNHQYVHLY